MTDDLLADDNLHNDASVEDLIKTDPKGYGNFSKEEVLKKAYNADLTIDLFKRRQDELRDDYLKLREEHTAVAKLQDLIDRLDTSKQLSNSEHTPAKEMDDKPVIDSKAIEDLVSNKIQEHELSRKQDTNFSQVVAKLEEQFGSNYKTALKQQADSLGLSSEDVNALARKSPTAFFKTFGIGEQKQDLFQSPTRSTQRTDTFAPASTKRTWTYYQNLKQKDPAAYSSAKTHNQMIDDMRLLGDAFRDGDYNKFG